ncbi:hypothetical protein [Scytonema sp. PCC 10023]|uniref:hypothetical protein n=1 Tax=Scytonema sp. PCC 10023 TaxID=1680591 RepID=UPI0039C69898
MCGISERVNVKRLPPAVRSAQSPLAALCMSDRLQLTSVSVLSDRPSADTFASIA